ncbi:hypothetical protein DMZ48_08050 [Robertkochia solimangrovi]|nr:hypothetical protein DMZ48_08050 [Robertkochia solimangrovi]
MPGIDDGATDTKVSMAMVDAYLEMGISAAYCTPHIMEDHYNLNAEIIHSVYDELKNNLMQGKSSFRIRPAAEHMTDPAFEQLVNSGKVLPHIDNIVLIETGFMAKPLGLEELLFKMRNKDYLPLLAHPERYGYIDSLDEYIELKNRGCLFQLNCLSLQGYYGKYEQQKAVQLLKNGLIDFVATDAHNPRHLQLISSIRLSKNLLKPLEVAIAQTNETFTF